ncbi:MAG: universal stress protein [Rubrobacteraceae bacterium]
MFPTRILLATDGSPGAEGAVEAAVELSTDTGSELHVLRSVSMVVEPPYARMATKDQVGGMLENRKLRAVVALDEQVGVVGKLGGEVADSYYREGKLDREAVRLAEELDAGLIVTGGREPGRAWKTLARILPFLGDPAERTLHRSRRPVLVVRA